MGSPPLPWAANGEEIIPQVQPQPPLAQPEAMRWLLSWHCWGSDLPSLLIAVTVFIFLRSVSEVTEHQLRSPRQSHRARPGALPQPPGSGFSALWLCSYHASSLLLL